VTSLAVVIPATDRRPTLDRVVAAIERAAEPPEEIIVVDEPAGLGPAAARNIGAQKAGSEIVVFIDADVEVHEDTFGRIRRAFDEDLALVAAFGSYDEAPGAPGIVSNFRNLLHHHVHHEGAGVATTFWAGLGAIRRDAFLEVGGFDEDRFPRPSVEDIELGARLYERGAKVILDPSIQGTHLKRWSLVGMLRTDLFARAVPWLRLILERRAGTKALNLGWRHRFATVVSVLAVVGVLRRSLAQVALAGGLLLVLERRFYGLLLRRGGLRLAAAGVPLHIAHRLTSVAAVPIALAGHLLAMRKRDSRG
jgi:hypothetical protein